MSNMNNDFGSDYLFALMRHAEQQLLNRYKKMETKSRQRNNWPPFLSVDEDLFAPFNADKKDSNEKDMFDRLEDLIMKQRGNGMFIVFTNVKPKPEDSNEKQDEEEVKENKETEKTSTAAHGCSFSFGGTAEHPRVVCPVCGDGEKCIFPGEPANTVDDIEKGCCGGGCCAPKRTENDEPAQEQPLAEVAPETVEPKTEEPAESTSDEKKDTASEDKSTTDSDEKKDAEFENLEEIIDKVAEKFKAEAVAALRKYKNISDFLKNPEDK